MTVRTIAVERIRDERPALTGPALLLVQDNWNDHGFQTQYHLFFVPASSKGREDDVLVGDVKILRKGQTAADGLQIHQAFEQLGAEFCSVGSSLDYYERLSSLPQQIRDFAVKALRDVVHVPRLRTEFEPEHGWEKSMFRDNRDPDGFLVLATGLLTGNYGRLATEDVRFSFTVPGWSEAVKFHFEPPASGESFFDEPRLPGSVVVLIGRNGSGKSTLLSRLARVALASSSERSGQRMRSLGTLEPSHLGFARVVTVSFSPFDSFHLPGADEDNRKQFLKDVEHGKGRFAFIGLRDIAAEPDDEHLQHPRDDSEEIDLDRRINTKLKSIGQLAAEFVMALAQARENVRLRDIEQAQQQLFPNGFFGDDSLNLKNCGEEEARRLFLRLSTGHKIALLVTISLLSRIKPHSLVLVDEPETHLHPPLLAALMGAVRKVLREYKSFAVVATHSPVVVQESLSEHVYVVRNSGSVTSVGAPGQETFGESIGLITSEVFGLHSEATGFHASLDRLLEAKLSMKEMEELFQGGRMSHQARGYLLSRLAEGRS